MSLALATSNQIPDKGIQPRHLADEIMALLAAQSPFLTRDIPDNNSDFIIVSQANAFLACCVEYVVRLLVSQKLEHGILYILQNTSELNFDHLYYTLGTIQGFTIVPNIVGEEVHLNIQTNAVGENIRLYYRVASVVSIT